MSEEISVFVEITNNMQAYIVKLGQELERITRESETRIDELEKENAEYKRVINQMRKFVEVEEVPKNKKEQISGHELLGTHGKILVIGGQELGTNVMNGIAKTMGFEKKDFDYVDYDKAKDYTDRIRRGGKYSAVIIGACPHKTTAGEGYSSVVEKFKRIEGMPFTTDARSKSGKLKVTKESFRNALFDVCANLRPSYVC